MSANRKVVMMKRANLVDSVYNDEALEYEYTKAQIKEIIDSVFNGVKDFLMDTQDGEERRVSLNRGFGVMRCYVRDGSGIIKGKKSRIVSVRLAESSRYKNSQ